RQEPRRRSQAVADGRRRQSRGSGVSQAIASNARFLRRRTSRVLTTLEITTRTRSDPNASRDTRLFDERLRSSALHEIFRDRGELFECGLQIVDDLASDDIGSGQVRAFFETLVLEPKDVEVHLVAFDQLFV